MFILVLNGSNNTGHASQPHMPKPATHHETSPLATTVLDLRQLTDLRGIMPLLAEKQVVYVGETHSSYAHHLIQLEIIRGIYRAHPDMAIGMEYFQWPFQQYLDQYVTGELDEKEMLRKSEYFQRWSYDYRLYRPILEFAREQGIPIVALNVPAELSKKVASGGIEALSEEERSRIPAEIDRSDESYRQRLLKVFDAHPKREDSNFEYFLEAQLLWDEGMAQRAAEYLRQHPDRKLVMLAGNGHVVSSGIPNRLERRLAVDSAIVVNDADSNIRSDMADYLLLPEERTLPPRGLMGAFLDDTDEGLMVNALEKQGPAETAGIKKGDRIVSINDELIGNLGDLRIALLDKGPGDPVRVEVIRKRVLLGRRRITFEFALDAQSQLIQGAKTHP